MNVFDGIGDIIDDDLVWMEDPMPWDDVDGRKRVVDAVSAQRRRRKLLPAKWPVQVCLRQIGED
jgi:hypothetical protein